MERAGVSPIRSLPPEILGEIFAPFSQSHESSGKERSGSVEEELEGLAKVELLNLAKVCSRWHRVILGTPRLWSDISVTLNCWADLSEATLFQNLLRIFLERGADHPLTISLVIYNDSTVEPTVSALTLLAQYSQRWQHMYYSGDPLALDHISHIKGKLDILGSLSFATREEEVVADLFQIAPRLTKVFLDLEYAEFCPKLPWDQLHSFACNALDTHDISFILDLMRDVSLPRAAFELECLNAWQLGPSHHLPQITVTLSSFVIETIAYKGPDYDTQSLDELFSCLTFLHLRKLTIFRTARSWPGPKTDRLYPGP
ncbi:hypothetical protein C8R43DRAFT_1076621 [Mycena crocata]|nr:hypothetical protein C8R43DRAFT_1076621 [Mycena crocata]